MSRPRRQAAPLALRTSVVLLLVLLLGSLLGLLVAHLKPSVLELRNAPPSAPTTTSTTSTTTTTTPAPVVSGGPVITAIEPSSASAGQTVRLVGRNLFSSGSIVAMFGSAQAPTSCPTRELCTAVVPPAPKGAATLKVHLQTSSGPSNSLTFRYG